MNVAFYAPLKSPDNPVPSGDRLVARSLVEALESGGHLVEMVSKLRTFDRDGDADRQARVGELGEAMQRRVLRRLAETNSKPDLWLTYHLYHKAPDWIGPGVSEALGIPYCIAEASVTPHQVDGPWAAGHQAVIDAIRKARLVININPKDEPGVHSVLPDPTRAVSMPPFINGQPFRDASARRPELRQRLITQFGLDPEVPWLLAVGMFRYGDKLNSYRLLAEALPMIADRPWQLLALGGGVARVEIQTPFKRLGDRVIWAGEQSGEAVAAAMAACDLMTWPSVNEAIGLSFVEAAMAGLPVVGADRPGIAQIVKHERTGLLVPEHDAEAFAAATASLIDDAPRRRLMGDAAAARAASVHDISTNGPLLCRYLESVLR